MSRGTNSSEQPRLVVGRLGMESVLKEGELMLVLIRKQGEQGGR